MTLAPVAARAHAIFLRIPRVLEELAGRQGFPKRGFAKANGISGFEIISRNRNDLASSNLCRRFRPFASLLPVLLFQWHSEWHSTLNDVFDGDEWRQEIAADDIDERADQAVRLLARKTGARWHTYIRMRLETTVARGMCCFI